MPTSRADLFLAGYYQHRAPDTAAAALEVFFDTPPHNVRQAARMFVRAAQVDPRIRAVFQDLSRQRPDLTERIDGLLTTADNPAFPDPATAPLSSPSDLDFQWAEFLLTGSSAPVERIASVLQRPDRTLAALVDWAGRKARLPWSKKARRDSTARMTDIGIILNTERANLGNAWDLDLTTWKRMSEGVNMPEVLPFTVDDHFIDHLMMKGSACWSLQSNARPHDTVQAIYAKLDASRLPRFA
ncbi:MAG: hypothetical protein ACI8RZ_001922 [Myxococcota bacterium]|jgi:hypothetical protein